MPAPVDPEVRAVAVALVADGHTCSAAARAVGVSQQSVRNWVAADMPALRAWERSRVVDDLGAPENRLERHTGASRGNGERPNLYCGWSGRPDPEIRDHEGLRTAMDAWHARVAHYAVEDLEDRYLRAHDPSAR